MYYTKYFLIIISLFLLFFILFSQNSNPNQIIIAHEDSENYPWIFPNSIGLDIELLKIVESNIGVKFSFIALP